MTEGQGDGEAAVFAARRRGSEAKKIRFSWGEDTVFLGRRYGIVGKGCRGREEGTKGV